MPEIKLLDGKKILFSKSIDGFELTEKISKSLSKEALVMEGYLIWLVLRVAH